MISANREGIFSTFGYLSLSLLGMTFGRLIFTTLNIQNEAKQEGNKEKEENSEALEAIMEGQRKK